MIFKNTAIQAENWSRIINKSDWNQWNQWKIYLIWQKFENNNTDFFKWAWYFLFKPSFLDLF